MIYSRDTPFWSGALEICHASSSSSSSSSSVCRAMSLGFTICGEIFVHMTVFFNPAIEVVTFCLRGWCVLGVFLFPAFTCQGHEFQDLLSLCNGMHVCTD